MLVAGAGGVFLWSGLKGKKFTDTLRNVISGNNPASGGGVAGGSAAGAYTGGSAVYDSSSKLQALWVANGGPQNTAAFAAAVAEAESSGNATVTSTNPDGGINVGIFQLDTRGVGAGYSVQQLQNPNTNTRITIAATRGGTDWSDWGDPITAQVGYHYIPGSPVPGGVLPLWIMSPSALFCLQVL